MPNYLFKILFSLFIVFVATTALVAQDIERCKWIKYKPQGVTLDTLSLVKGSLKIKNQPTLKATYDLNTNQVKFN